MKVKFFLLFFLFSASHILIWAQYTIRGVVKDEITDKPIENASVYFNNTQIGVKTDANGNFMLYTDKHYEELVISSIGYEKILIKSPGKSTRYQFLLKEKSNTLKPIIIDNGGGWKRWGNLFFSLLMSSDPYAYSGSKIINPEAIKFEYDKSTNILRAVSYEPILVSHPQLGYLLSIDLELFEYNLLTEKINYETTVFFEEKVDKLNKEQIQLNTNNSYLGSKDHFFKALVEHRLAEEGFKIYRYSSVKDLEKARISSKVNALKQQQILSGYIGNYITLDKLIDRDSIKYFSTVLARPDEKSRKLDAITEDSICNYDAEKKITTITFKDSILVVYHFKPELSRTHIASRANYHSYTKAARETIMFLIDNSPLLLNDIGRPKNNNLMMIGAMAELRMAHLLPLNFDFLVPRFRKDE